MDSNTLAQKLADPIQVLGMSYYFAPGTAAHAGELGINVFEFYGLGRGGVLGNADEQAVFDAFRFFHRNAIAFLYTASTAKADPVATAVEHVKAAYAFADATFGAVSTSDLARLAELSAKVLAGVPEGRYPLVDGYRRLGPDTNPVHAGYYATILLRELRGGVHIDCADEVGLTAEAACYLQDEGIFKLHGYGDADVPVDPESFRPLKEQAEARTDVVMGEYFAVLSDGERDEMARIAEAMNGALAAPVAVA